MNFVSIDELTVGRAFASVAPELWHRLLYQIRRADSDYFQISLKTYLYNLTFLLSVFIAPS